MDQERGPGGIDTSVAHPARIYDYWLGGKDNFAADREVGAAIVAASPDFVEVSRQNRAFLSRAVGHLAGQAGVTQFLDIGTGIPTAGNTHEVAQAAAPDAKTVYVDNDPVVLAHAQALLVGETPGSTAYIHADLRDPDTILDGARATLDFDRPVAVMLLGIAEFIPDAEIPDIVARLMAPLASGSALVISHSTAIVDPEGMAEAARLWNEGGSTPIRLRSTDEIAALFTGLDMMEPGVVSCSLWHPGPSQIGAPAPVDAFAAVGRKR